MQTGLEKPATFFYLVSGTDNREGGKQEVLSLPLSLCCSRKIKWERGVWGWCGVVEHPLKCEKLLHRKEEEKLKIHPE